MYTHGTQTEAVPPSNTMKASCSCWTGSTTTHVTDRLRAHHPPAHRVCVVVNATCATWRCARGALRATPLKSTPGAGGAAAAGPTRAGGAAPARRDPVVGLIASGGRGPSRWRRRPGAGTTAPSLYRYKAPGSVPCLRNKWLHRTRASARAGRTAPAGLVFFAATWSSRGG